MDPVIDVDECRSSMEVVQLKGRRAIGDFGGIAARGLDGFAIISRGGCAFWGIDRPAMQRHQEDTGLTFERAPKREGGIG